MTNLKLSPMKKLIRIVTGLIVAHQAGAAWCQPDPPISLPAGPRLHWQVSPYTLHFSPSEDHKNVVMVGLEREYPNGQLDGVTVFSNSFGQPSVFFYPWGGIYRDILGLRPLAFKWTAGLLYGYKDPYENKVPLNHKGFSPGAIIALAYEFQSGWSAQIDMLGTAGLMFQFNKPIE